jgi:hypothetical protein
MEGARRGESAILKGLAEKVLKMGLDASPDELVAWVEAEKAKMAAIFAEQDRRE